MKTFQLIRSSIVFKLQFKPRGGYTITIPSLPGCISYNETFEQAIKTIEDIIKSWLAIARKKHVLPDHFKTVEVTAI